MSYAQGIPTIEEFFPDVAFPPAQTLQAPPAHTFVQPDVLHQPPAGVGNVLGDHVGGAMGHAGDALAHQLHDLVAPALIGLEALSGALLIGRAAMATSQVLARAALSAAKAQDELREQQTTAAKAAECWREAVCAAARTNARIEALHARIRRGALPDGPELPPPLSPVGMKLGAMWAALAETDRRLRQAEAACARATMEAALGPVDALRPETVALHERLRARRREALEAYERSDAAGEVPQAAPVSSTRVLSEEEVARLGGELLAELPRQVAAVEYQLIEEKIAAALEAITTPGGRPAAARRHLREARRFAERAQKRQVDEEWAARQLAFLRDTRSGAPSGASTVPLPDASAEIAVLEGVLDKGLELSDTERQRIADRVHQWMGAFQRIYVAEVIRAELRRSSAGTAERSVHGEVQVIDSSPPGWDDHVLRISMDGQGTARVSTRRREPPKGEETQTYEDLLLDWERCAEAPRHVRELERLTALAGLTLTFEFEEPPPKPEPRHASRPARDDRPAPKTRSHDQEGRP